MDCIHEAHWKLGNMVCGRLASCWIMMAHRLFVYNILTTPTMQASCHASLTQTSSMAQVLSHQFVIDWSSWCWKLWLWYHKICSLTWMVRVASDSRSKALTCRCLSSSNVSRWKGSLVENQSVCEVCNSLGWHASPGSHSILPNKEGCLWHLLQYGKKACKAW